VSQVDAPEEKKEARKERKKAPGPQASIQNKIVCVKTRNVTHKNSFLVRDKA
jgi:hypothetical protein